MKLTQSGISIAKETFHFTLHEISLQLCPPLDNFLRASMETSPIILPWSLCAACYTSPHHWLLLLLLLLLLIIVAWLNNNASVLWTSAFTIVRHHFTIIILITSTEEITVFRPFVGLCLFVSSITPKIIDAFHEFLESIPWDKKLLSRLWVTWNRIWIPEF